MVRDRLASVMVFSPEHPKRDQNLKFTPLSETTSLITPFIWESPSPPVHLAGKRNVDENTFTHFIILLFSFGHLLKIHYLHVVKPIQIFNLKHLYVPQLRNISYKFCVCICLLALAVNNRPMRLAGGACRLNRG